MMKMSYKRVPHTNKWKNKGSRVPLLHSKRRITSKCIRRWINLNVRSSIRGQAKMIPMLLRTLLIKDQKMSNMTLFQVQQVPKNLRTKLNIKKTNYRKRQGTSSKMKDLHLKKTITIRQIKKELKRSRRINLASLKQWIAGNNPKI